MKERDFPTSSPGLVQVDKGTAIDQVADTLNRVSSLAYELRLLADRLAGPLPEDEKVGNCESPAGVIPDLHFRAKMADKHMDVAYRDIDRIGQLI